MDSEIEKLQGTWKIVELEVEGKKMPASAVRGSKIMVAGSNFTTSSMGAIYEGTLEVDPGATPKALNMKFTAGPERGNTNLAIYELDGDTWKLCLNMSGKSRPNAFATSPGSGNALETLERETVTRTEIQVPSDLPAVPELEGEWRMISCVRDGHPLDTRMLKSARRIAKGNETTTMFGNRVFMQARYVVDRTKAPHTIDFYRSDGETQYGIYELSGKIFKVCFSGPGDPRPAVFESVEGDGRTLTEWMHIN